MDGVDSGGYGQLEPAVIPLARLAGRQCTRERRMLILRSIQITSGQYDIVYLF